jgi:Tfp pilus assembly protein PilZ
MESGGREGRRYPRLDVPLKFKIKDEGTGWSEHIVNLSSGGMHLKTPQKYNIGDMVTIDMICNYGGFINTYMRICGKVLRVFDKEDGYEIALEFVGMGDDQQNILGRIATNS